MLLAAGSKRDISYRKQKYTPGRGGGLLALP
jgi:hypothetical protein